MTNWRFVFGLLGAAPGGVPLANCESLTQAYETLATARAVVTPVHPIPIFNQRD